MDESGWLLVAARRGGCRDKRWLPGQGGISSSLCHVEVDRTPEPLTALPSSYRHLFDRVLTVCENDPRIRALWLSGSLAKGTADAGSDLDTLIAVRDEDFDDFVARWRTG